MRVLCPIVEAVANLVPIGCADVILRSRIGSKRVGDDNLGRPYPFMIRLRNFSAAALSRFAMTTASKIFPFGQPFRPRHALRVRPQNFVSRVAPGVAYRSHALPAYVNRMRRPRSDWSKLAAVVRQWQRCGTI